MLLLLTVLTRILLICNSTRFIFNIFLIFFVKDVLINWITAKITDRRHAQHTNPGRRIIV